MRASVVIAAHNEGVALAQTIRAVVESTARLNHEILVIDDGSDDDCVALARERFPQIRTFRHGQRQGTSPAKHRGACEARGDVLVFLDGHCNPEPGSIERLVDGVERTGGDAIITPAIPSLDVERWTNRGGQVGHGYRVQLDTIDCGWVPLSSLRKVRRAGCDFYESPAAIGCALAIHRTLYDKLRGFDPQMLVWGVEDMDLSLKCWLLGHAILHDPEPRIGHRFRQRFDNYDVPIEHVVVNKLRMYPLKR